MLKPLLIFTVLFFANKSTYSQDSLNLNWNLYKLSNGLTVLLQPDQSVKEVSVEFWIHCGTRNEVAGKYGLAHFFEHATPYGLQNNKDEMTLFRSYLSNSNAQTKKDFIRYYLQVKPEGLDLALKYSADRLKADTSLITDEIIERHRTNVLAEIERNSKNPFWGAEAKMARDGGTFGEKHPYGHGGYGTIRENRNYTTHDVRKWYSDFVFANNTALFIVGNFDEKKTKELIEKYFKDIRQKKVTSRFSASTGKRTSSTATIKAPTEHHCISLTWAIPGWGSADDAALRLLANILDFRFADTSLFPLPVVKAESGNLLSLYEYAGQFGVYSFFTSLSDSVSIEKILYRAVDSLIRFGISKEELILAQNKEIGYIKEMMSELGFQWSRTELLGEGLFFKNDPGYYLNRIKKQSVLTTEDIRKAAKKWLGKKAFRLLTVSAREDK